jgi:putative flippase GtrA
VVAAVETGSRSVALPTQIIRFLLVGGFSAVVDFGIYQALLAVDTWVHLARALSFICGTTTAFLLSRRWAFNSRGGSAPAIRFAILYSTTFCVNVGVNALMLQVQPEWAWEITVAWVISQGIATMINFVLLRAVVFRD